MGMQGAARQTARVGSMYRRDGCQEYDHLLQRSLVASSEQTRGSAERSTKHADDGPVWSFIDLKCLDSLLSMLETGTVLLQAPSKCHVLGITSD